MGSINLIVGDDLTASVEESGVIIASGASDSVAVFATAGDAWSAYDLEVVMFSAPIGWPKATGVGTIVSRSESITHASTSFATVPEDILRRAGCNLYVGLRGTKGDSVMTSQLAYVCTISQGANPEDGGEIGASKAEKIQNQVTALTARLANSVAELNTYKVPYPLETESCGKYGTEGMVLRTKGNGKTEWAEVGQPTDDQVESVIEKHPEWQTEVPDGGITERKLDNSAYNVPISHFGTDLHPEIGVFGDVPVQTENYFAAQQMHKYGDYYIFVNAYTTGTSGGVETASAMGCDFIVTDSSLTVLNSAVSTDVGHGNGGCIIGDYLYITGDAYTYKRIVSKVYLPDLLKGTLTITQINLDDTGFDGSAIYSICTDGTYIYGSSGYNIYKFNPDNFAEYSLVTHIGYTTQQSIYLIDDSLYVLYWYEDEDNSDNNRNYIFEYSLKTGDHISTIEMPYNMGDEFCEINGMTVRGTADDSYVFLVYFNSYGLQSNYIASVNFRKNRNDVINEYINKPYLPISFDTRDYSIYYKPSYHGIQDGTESHPFNSNNVLQRAMSISDRYSYIVPLEDVDSLTLINVKKNVTIENKSGNSFTINDLFLYYCDIVDVLVDSNITAYKCNVVHYAHADGGKTFTFDYIGRVIINACTTANTIAHARNCQIESLSEINITESVDCDIEWRAVHNNVDAIGIVGKNVVCYVDCYGPNNLPSERRGIVEIVSNLNLSGSYYVYKATFTTYDASKNTIQYVNFGMQTASSTDVTWYGWKQVTMS